MSRSEYAALPAPPTQEELDRARIGQLKSLFEKTREHWDEPKTLGRYYRLMGLHLDHEDWGQVQLVRDTIASLWIPRRSGGIA